MLHVTDNLIHSMTDIIVRECHPEKVVLFGSYARGTANPDSDLDFMIIKNTQQTGKSREKALEALWQVFFSYDLPIDFLIYSPEEIKKWKDAPNHIVAHALNEGKVLYERH